MKYFIAYLIKGDAKKYHKGLMNGLFKEFRIDNLSRRIPPHLTLKVPFEFSKISEVEKLIRDFCKKNKKTKIKLKGFGNFNKKVIYLNTFPSVETLNLIDDFLLKLKSIKNISWSRNEIESLHLHSTIAMGNIGVKFDKIWKHLSERFPDYDLEFDNISILKKIGGKWEVHKEFCLG